MNYNENHFDTEVETIMVFLFSVPSNRIFFLVHLNMNRYTNVNIEFVRNLPINPQVQDALAIDSILIIHFFSWFAKVFVAFSNSILRSK